jgi:hypothetical protein
MLNEKNNRRTFEVVNAGEVSYQSTQELIKIQRKILRYNPDMVIVFDGRNDIYNSHKEYWTPEINHDTIIVLQKTMDTSLGSLIYHFQRFVIDNPILSKSSIIPLLSNLGYQKTVRSTYQKGIIRPEAIDEYGNNHEMMAQILVPRGIKAIFIFQPTLGYGNKIPSGYEVKILGRIKENSNWLDVLKVMMPLGEKSVLDLSEKYDVKAASFVNIFDEYNETIYADSVHYTDHGNEILAREMVKLIAGVGLLE